MNLAFACPKCDATTRVEYDGAQELACAHCGYEVSPAGDVLREGRVTRCAVCDSPELFVRKDFSQRLGILIIAIGFLASTVTWYFYWQIATYAILFSSAMLDVILFFTVPNLLECYRCHAQYRGLPELDSYEPFKLEVHEKYRQQAIRQREAERAHAASHPPGS